METSRRKILIVGGSLVALFLIALAALIIFANAIAKSQVQKALGKNSRVERISLAWNKVDVYGLELLTEGRKRFFYAPKIEVNASVLTIFRKRLSASRLTVEQPSVALTIDKQGKLVNPLGPKSGPLPSIEIRHLSVSNGTLTVVNEHVKPSPQTLRLTGISLRMDTLFLPFSPVWTDWQFSGSIPGRSSTGQLRWVGKTDFLTYDTTGKLTLRDLDILVLKPYMPAEGAIITGGSLDVAMDVAIKNKSIHAPTHAVIRNVQLGPAGGMAGIPGASISNLLKTSGNELSLDFIVEGRLDNPKFSPTQDMVTKVVDALTRKIGLPSTPLGRFPDERTLKGLEKGLGGLLK